MCVFVVMPLCNVDNTRRSLLYRHVEREANTVFAAFRRIFASFHFDTGQVYKTEIL